MECADQWNIDLGEDVMLINQIAPSGQLAKWNAAQSGAVVREGDRIAKLGGAATADQIMSRMHEKDNTDITLQIVRPTQQFTVSLAKRGQALGLGFRTAHKPTDQRLLIAQVLPEGAAATYNAEQASKGQWDRLLTPNMVVTAINGTKDDTQRMMELIRSCQKINLQVQRFGSRPATMESPLSPGLRIKEWKVALNRDATANPGFEVLDFREKCRAKLGLDIHKDVLLVSRVHKSGQLAMWNAKNPGAMVRRGDLILEVDGQHTAQGMRRACQEVRSKSAQMSLRLARPPNSFNMRCKKSGRALGLKLRKAKTRAELLITDVVPGNLVADHNAVKPPQVGTSLFRPTW
jgi:hypothetical protein